MWQQFDNIYQSLLMISYEELHVLLIHYHTHRLLSECC